MARVGSLFTLGLAFGGCVHSTGASYEEPPLTRASYPKAVARAYCDVLGGCCATAGLDFAEEACLERIELPRRLEAMDASLLGLAFDSDAAAACVDALSALEGCGEPPLEEWEACTRVYVGIVRLGEPCEYSSQCAGAQLGQAHCSSELGSICVAEEPDLPLPGVGELCDHFCGEGAYCDSTFTCAPKIASGSCAESSDACAAVSYCDDTTMQCVAKSPDGEMCEYGSTCSSGGCNDGVCGPFTFATRATCSGTADPI